MEIDEIIRENLNLSDKKTLQYVNAITLTEAAQNQFLIALTSKLYDKIQEKATKIDFSTIEMSKGDITKIQNYDSIVECLDIIRKIVIEYKESPESVDIVSTAIFNLKNRKKLFQKAFTYGTSLPILTYDNTALAIVESTSFMISTCIEYIKDPGAEDFKMALDITAYNRTEQNLLFQTLSKFNKSCSSKELDNAFSFIMSHNVATREAVDAEYARKESEINNEPFLTDDEIENGDFEVVQDLEPRVQEEGAKTVLSYASSKILLWLAKPFISTIRMITYYHYLHKQKISAYYQDLADCIAMNANQIKYDKSRDKKEREKIAREQMKIAEKFRRRANEEAIDYKASKNGADKMNSNEANQFNGDDVDDNSNPDNASIFESGITESFMPVDFSSLFKVASPTDRAK